MLSTNYPPSFYVQALADKERLSEQLTLEKQTGRLEFEQLEDKSRDQDRRVHSLTAERDLLVNKVCVVVQSLSRLYSFHQLVYITFRKCLES